MLGKPRVRDKLLIRMKKVLARPTKRLCEYLFAVKSLNYFVLFIQNFEESEKYFKGERERGGQRRIFLRDF